ncbi:MAG: hypothetical protein J5I94_28170 [Phaeodactylibacter sp.]|nr:hypothetical protein [Phaeodactylibacter sp.]
MSIRPIIILLLLFPFSLPAQIEGLIKDKDIIWAAEVESVICFDAITRSLPPQVLEAIPVKVIQETPDSPALHPFAREARKLIRQGAFPAFADRGLRQPLSHREALGHMVAVDTIVVFDPETYEEKIHVVRKDMLENTSFFAVRQLWLYNGKKNELETIALAIAPAIERPSQTGEFHPLVWFRLPPPRRSLARLKSPAVQFATHLEYTVAEEQIEVLKGEETHLKKILIERLKKGELTGYDQWNQPIPLSEAEGIFIHQDTIITFDPETYEENVQAVRMEFGPMDITDFHVQQNWLFAPSRNSLQCITTALGPAIPVIDEYGTQMALKPLFFWRRE